MRRVAVVQDCVGTVKLAADEVADPAATAVWYPANVCVLVIVVVNTDPGAPILAHADYAVLGDLREVIPALVAALRARSGPS